MTTPTRGSLTLLLRSLMLFLRLLVLVPVLAQWHLFGEGHYDTDKFYLYYVILVNCSQCWALWCLVVFYNEFKEDLWYAKKSRVPQIKQAYILLNRSIWRLQNRSITRPIYS